MVTILSSASMMTKYLLRYQRCTVSTCSVTELFKSKDCSALIGKFVSVNGWITSVRNQKEFTFLHLADGLSPKLLQVVIPKTIDLPIDECFPFSAVVIKGLVVESPKKGQTFELIADSLQVLSKGTNEAAFPFTSKDNHPPDYVRKYLHLRSKTARFSNTLRLRSLLTSSIHDYFHKNNFVQIHTPVLTSNDCEGGGEIFSIKPDSQKLCQIMAKEGKTEEEAYFDKKVFLTVSGQLHLEAVCSGIGKVYNLNPAFRAENSRGRRHLSEFWMVEAEMNFAFEISKLLSVMENLVRYCAEYILSHDNGEIAVLEKTAKGVKEHLIAILDKPFERITYSDAVKILLDNTSRFQTKPVDGDDFGKEHELFITSHLGNKPTFVTNWPRHLKPFYARFDEEKQTASAVDLLVPDVGELCGGSLREFNYDNLRSRLEALRLLNQLDWYLELRKFGGTPTGGFGLGFERLMSYLFKINHIRDTIPFPRSPHNCQL